MRLNRVCSLATRLARSETHDAACGINLGADHGSIWVADVNGRWCSGWFVADMDSWVSCGKPVAATSDLAFDRAAVFEVEPDYRSRWSVPCVDENRRPLVELIFEEHERSGD